METHPALTNTFCRPGVGADDEWELVRGRDRIERVDQIEEVLVITDVFIAMGRYDEIGISLQVEPLEHV